MSNLKEELLALHKEMDKHIEWNFGVCPKEKYFDKLLEKMSSLQDQIQSCNDMEKQGLGYWVQDEFIIKDIEK